MSDATPNAWRFQGPSVRDPRLVVSATLLTVHVLGQTVVHWPLSVAQILAALIPAAAIEVAVVARRQRLIAWPASALLTGNGVALLLRVPGTVPGEYWSTNGWWYFAGTAVVAMASKYAFRVDGRPWFNPSNIALVGAFLVLGSNVVDPQDLWWGDMSLGLVAIYAVLMVGGTAITLRQRSQRIVVPFFATFALGCALLAIGGHHMTARWYIGPIGGLAYWQTVVLSPELLIFMFFMITDPKTIPRRRSHYERFGVLTAALAVALFATQSTEFGTKVALLSALVLACAGVPWIDRVGSRQIVAATATAGLVALAVPLVGWFELPAAGDRRAAVEWQGAVPAIRVDADVRALAGDIGPAEAQEVVSDALNSLASESAAVEAGDRAAVRAAVAGPRRAEALARTRRKPTVSFDYRVESATITVYRTTSGAQALPTLAVHALGTAVERNDGTPVASEPLDSLFVLQQRESGWQVFHEIPS